MHVTLPFARAGLLSSAEARAAAACLFPLVAGAVAPWLMWGVGGRLSAGDVAAATLASVVVMLRVMFRTREQAARDVWRGQAPRPALAAVLCSGLALSLIVPGASAFALIDAVGLPRVAGDVRAYDFAELATGGVTFGLSGAFGAARLAPDGTARLSDGRAHASAAHPAGERTLAWRLVPGGICIGSARCLMLDRSSGRLWRGREDVGRVIAVQQPAS